VLCFSVAQSKTASARRTRHKSPDALVSAANPSHIRGTADARVQNRENSMADSLIQEVSDTAFMVATYRAMETERPDALFRDPLAGKLSGAHGENIVASLPRMARMGRWFVTIRTCIIDRFIQDAVAQGVDTVLNLGAGLDTRPYRMNLPASLRWIEVDYPKIIELKESRLANETPHCRLERIKLDLTEAAARRQLLADVAGSSAKCLVLTEGVVLYLTTEDAAALADELSAHPSFRYWIVDYLAPHTIRRSQRAKKKMKMQNAPFRFDPPDYFDFFKAHGWQAKEVRYIPEEAATLKRPPEFPLPILIWIKFLRLFLSKTHREGFVKSAAYVLFEPAESAGSAT
jgi:methyltransferase (TIGR00027 family)